MSSKLSDYDYPLPEAQIAKRPLPRRDEARMMVLHRDSQTIEHRQFRDLKAFLKPGDLLVLNNTRVLPARRFSDDHAVEFLFLEKLGSARWKCLVKPGRKMRAGVTTKIDNVLLRVEEILPDGERIVALAEDIDLYAHGSMPLPPYIGRESDLADNERYQTVFAQNPGALAAPTAGLHFTPEIFIYPPFEFRVVDVLLTNFHLPRSTLLMLVGAFAGREFLLRSYEEAIRQRYRFYSYGDCMLIL